MQIGPLEQHGENAAHEPRARGRKLRPPGDDWLPPLVYMAGALALTWPWMIHPASTIAAPLGGDVAHSVIKFDAIAREGIGRDLPLPVDHPQDAFERLWTGAAGAPYGCGG
jgi:hypothetical protein